MTNTHKLALTAILSALSFVLMLFNFPIIPAADFLKIDFSIVPIMLALVMFDLRSAYTVLLLRSALKLFLDNQGPNTYIGLPMNIVALGLFITVFALIWNKKKNRSTYLLSSVLGTLVLALAMVVLNYFFAIPLYAKFANFDISAYIGISKYLVSMVVPFNIVEGIIFSLLLYPMYIACKPIIERHH